eukprot:TRINITY_DN5500_c0_g1_i4.p1 TRINITY_DN5500_c0_g1~~TRINITY_DN5500_c0_g1_i4.p1  ORF type:complete len:271 (+),score=-17.81 TRINITY_DN5500_c0_g1_i4:60-872(+)
MIPTIKDLSGCRCLYRQISIQEPQYLLQEKSWGRLTRNQKKNKAPCINYNFDFCMSALVQINAEESILMSHFLLGEQVMLVYLLPCIYQHICNVLKCLHFAFQIQQWVDQFIILFNILNMVISRLVLDCVFLSKFQLIQCQKIMFIQITLTQLLHDEDKLRLVSRFLIFLVFKRLNLKIITQMTREYVYAKLLCYKNHFLQVVIISWFQKYSCGRVNVNNILSNDLAHFLSQQQVLHKQYQIRSTYMQSQEKCKILKYFEIIVININVNW